MLAAASVVLSAALGVALWRRQVAQRVEAADAARRPRDARGVVIGGEPFALAGTNGAAVLLLHGFNDTPQSMRYLAARLHAAGYTVRVPRLPGHGCALPELARDARADDWRRAVAAEYAVLREGHDALFVCGQSMGGALAVSLATSQPDVRALVLLAPFIGLEPQLGWKFRLARLSPAKYHRSPGAERSIHDPEARRAALGPGIVTAGALLALRTVALAAERALGALTLPTLYIQSVHDNRITEDAAQRHFAAIGAREKAQHWLSNSGHIISADYDRDEVAARVQDWFARHRSGPAT